MLSGVMSTSKGNATTEDGQDSDEGGTHGSDYGDDGLTAVHWAAWHGHLETVKVP